MGNDHKTGGSRTVVAGRYVLEAELGRGGLGVVYRALDQQTNTHVALKKLAVAAEAADDLQREFKAAVELQHPHIVRLLDYDAKTDGGYLTMELLDSQPLLAYGRTVGLDAVLARMMEALDALDYLHRRNWIHGDIKPDNMLISVSESPCLKLVDFGLSAVSGLVESAGTPAYLAPEISTGGARTSQSDLYSLGVVMYELLSGHNPFLANTPGDCERRHLMMRPRSLHEVVSGVPLSVAVMVDRLLEKAPEKRYADPADAIRALEPVVGDVASRRFSRRCRVMCPEPVGWERPLSEIDAALERVSNGDGGTLLFEGEAGVGKSRLCDAIRTRAQVRGIDVVLFDGAAHETGDTFQPLLAAGGQRVLIADNVDLLPPKVVPALARAIQTARESGTLLAITSTPSRALGRACRLDGVLLGAEARGECVRTRLPYLTRTQTAELIERAFGAPACGDDVVDPIGTFTLGCPGDILAVLRHLADTGRLVFTGTCWKTAGDGALLSGGSGLGNSPMEQVLSGRMMGLSEAETAVLLAAAAAGEPSTSQELQVLADVDEETVQGAIGELVGQSLLSWTADEKLALTQQVFVAHIRATTSAEEWRAVHHRAADHFIVEAGLGGGGVDRLARHSASADLVVQSVRYGRLAADEAEKNGRLPEARDVLRRLDKCLTRAEEPHPLHRLILIDYGRVLQKLGHYDVALDALDRASVGTLRLRHTSEAAELLRTKTFVLARLGRLDEARELSTSLMEVATASGVSERIEAVLTTVEIARLGGDYARARETLASEFAARLQAMEPGTEARLRVALARIDWHEARIGDAKENAIRALTLYERQGDARGAAEAEMALGTAFRMAGSHQTAIDYYMSAAEHYDDQDAIADRGKCYNNVGVCLHLMGRWEEAASRFEDALRLSELTSDVAECAVLQNNLGYCHMVRGAFEPAIAAFERGLAMSAEGRAERVRPALFGNLGEALACAGRPEEARAQLDTAVACAEALGSRGDVVENRRRLAQLALDAGEPAQADAAAAEAYGEADKLGLTEECAHLRRIRGLAAIHRGLLIAAAKQLTEAVTLASSDPDSIISAEICLARAELALARTEVDAAAELADHACRAFERLHAAWHLDHAKRTHARILAATRPTAPEKPGPNVLGDALLALTTAGSAQSALSIVLNAARTVTGADRAAAYIPGTAYSEELRLGVAVPGVLPDTDRLEAFSRTVSTRVMDTGQPVCLERVATDETMSAAASLRAIKLASVICVPVPLDLDGAGLLYLESRTPGRLTAAELPTVLHFAAALGLAVRIHLKRAQVEDITEVLSVSIHEMASPIAAIQGHSELTELEVPREETSGPFRTLMDVIADQSTRLFRLVADARQFSSLARLSLTTLRATAIDQLVTPAITGLQPEITAAAVSVNVQVAPDVPAVMADQLRVQQVLTNLMANAIRYSPADGTIHVRVSRAEASTAFGQASMVTFEIHDQGVGLTDLEKAAVFEKFKRGQTPRGEGTGLGLAITRTIVRAHGGRIEALDSPEGGTCIRFTLRAETSALSTV